MTDRNLIIAIVDDDPIYRFTSVRSIQRQQLADNVLEFNSGSEALDFLTNHSADPKSLPDIILLDINMPDINGIEIAQLLKDKQVIFTSAYPEFAER